MPLTLTSTYLLRSKAYIDGQWTSASDGRCLNVTNPATGEVIGKVPDCTAEDARTAVDAAQLAFEKYRHSVARERVALLRRWHALVINHQEDLARLMSLEQGKPLTESRAEVAYGASYIEWFAEEAKRAGGEIIPQQQNNHRLLVIRQPVGVVAAITPWNFPLAMLARKIAPALAAGCSVVCKPAEDTPLTALAMAALLEEAGAPKGLVNVLSSSRERAAVLGDAWLADFRVRKISFTGSTPVGKHLARQSADTLKRLSLELGGNAPFIVFEDADLDAAVTGLMVSKFRNAGQTCICPNRVYVQQGIYKKFIRLLAEKVSTLKVGPAGSDAEIGPLINARAIEKVEAHLKDAVERGARIIAGGIRYHCTEAPNGHFFTPTVVADVDAGMRMSCEETFGPVVPVTPFTTQEEVIRLANDTPYGLAAYFYSRDIDRIWTVAEAIEAGMVAVNDGVLSTEIAPFGGIKESGYGREGSQYGIDEYLNIKYIRHGNVVSPKN